jgi:small-conductance mechanosensitive channel
MTRLRRQRISLKIGLTYQTPPQICAQIPRIVGELVAALGKCTLVRCGMTGFGDSTLDFAIHFDVQSDSYEVAFEAQNRFCIALLERFNNEKIDFAYPTQVSIPAPSGFTPVPPTIASAEPAPPSPSQG